MRGRKLSFFFGFRLRGSLRALNFGGLGFLQSSLLFESDAFLGSLCFLGSLGFFRGCSGNLRLLCLCRGFRTLGFGDLGLLDCLLLFGNHAGFFGSPCQRCSLGLLACFSPLRRQSGLFLRRKPRFFSSRHASLFSGELVALRLRQLRIEPIGICRKVEIPCLPGANPFSKFVVAPGGGIGVGGTRGQRCHGGYQRDVIAAERTVDERFLLVVGGLQNI